MISNLEIDNLTNYQNYFKNFNIYLYATSTTTYNYVLKGFFAGFNTTVNIPIIVNNFTSNTSTTILTLSTISNTFSLSNLSSSIIYGIQYYQFYSIYDVMQQELYFSNTIPQYLPHQVVSRINFTNLNAGYIQPGLYNDTNLWSKIVVYAPIVESVVKAIQPLIQISSATDFGDLYNNYITYLQNAILPTYNIELYNFIKSLTNTLTSATTYVEFIDAQYNFVNSLTVSNTNIPLVTTIIESFMSLSSQTTFVGFVNGLMQTLLSFSNLQSYI